MLEHDQRHSLGTFWEVEGYLLDWKDKERVSETERGGEREVQRQSVNQSIRKKQISQNQKMVTYFHFISALQKARRPAGVMCSAGQMAEKVLFLDLAIWNSLANRIHSTWFHK